MKKPLFPIVLSQFIKLILLLLSLQLSLISYAHADDIQFNSVRYIDGYGFLGVGDNGLAAYSKLGSSWNKIILPAALAGVNLLEINTLNDGKPVETFTILAADNHKKYRNYEFKVDNGEIQLIKSELLNYPDNFVLLGARMEHDTGVYSTYGYLTDNNRFIQWIYYSNHLQPPKLVEYMELPKIYNVPYTYSGGAQLYLQTPYHGSQIILALWNHRDTRKAIFKNIQPSGIASYDGFAGESYAIDIIPNEHGVVKVYKITEAGLLSPYKTINTGMSISESGVIAVTTPDNDGLVAVASDLDGAGVEVADLPSGRITHVPIAPRTCGIVAEGVKVFLGKDKFALVTTSKGPSAVWRIVPISGL